MGGPPGQRQSASTRRRRPDGDQPRIEHADPHQPAARQDRRDQPFAVVGHERARHGHHAVARRRARMSIRPTAASRPAACGRGSGARRSSSGSAGSPASSRYAGAAKTPSLISASLRAIRSDSGGSPARTSTIQPRGVHVLDLVQHETLELEVRMPPHELRHPRHDDVADRHVHADAQRPGQYARRMSRRRSRARRARAEFPGRAARSPRRPRSGAAGASCGRRASRAARARAPRSRGSPRTGRAASSLAARAKLPASAARTNSSIRRTRSTTPPIRERRSRLTCGRASRPPASADPTLGSCRRSTRRAT